jgi:3-carboxy-cis,cis-muconate cycloisomerase
MRAVFSEERRLQTMLDVEAALARAQASLGIVPQAAADAITAAAGRADEVDRAAIVAGTENVGYPVVPLTRELARLAGTGAAGYVHWGATTQDVMDTSLVLQLRAAFALLDADLSGLIRALAARAQTHRNDVMAGRTHLQHALPLTFGYKCAVWLAPLCDALVALRAARDGALVLQFGGAVGTLASLGSNARAVTLALARELDLRVPDAPWHADRSRLATTATTLAIACASIAKFATDVVLLMQTEVGEVFEPHAPGRGGSSTMPQKRNPIASEYAIAAARGVRTLMPLVLEAMVGDHERSTGPWQSEEIALPQIFVLASAAFAHARAIAEGMTVDVARMRSNVDLTHGLIVSESVAMALAERIGKARAHHAVERACGTVLASGADLATTLAHDPDVAGEFDVPRLRELLDPARYVGEAGAVVDRVVARAENVLFVGGVSKA